MYLLIPGRHHLLTTFQFQYLNTLIQTELEDVKDLQGKGFNQTAIEGIVFAVTSANHSGTKRNPLPFYIRAMNIQMFARDLHVPVFIYGIDDVGLIDDFASYTIKQIAHQSDQRLNLNPQNTTLVCSTPVLQMYQNLGYRILQAELEDENTYQYHTQLPWYWVENIGKNPQWDKNAEIVDHIHPSTLDLWKTYGFGAKIRQILNDPIIGDDGDITESRDYSSYVRQMDEIAELKYEDTAGFIKSGNVGDIGCAVGSWIKLATEDKRLIESDFYGIEVARKLYDICNQRKHNNEFNNPNVFFSQKNAVTDLVFQKGRMDTIHTSSLTHEIGSYGSISDLEQFISNRYEELNFGGVWINRDVIGPVHGEKEIYLWLNDQDGDRLTSAVDLNDFDDPTSHLNNLSTHSRFIQFGQDFRREENDTICYEMVKIDELTYARLKLTDACEFLLTKDYTDNWLSEMHERFCFWSIEDWRLKLEATGFQLHMGSHDYTNPWIAENRFEGKVKLFERVEGELIELSHPPTNAIIVGKKL